MKKTFEGYVYYEIIEMNGKKYEHAGFKDDKNEFGDLMLSIVGPDKPKRRARITIELLE
ncbi:MAG: hypothetical protein J7K68_00950 [Candidatus Diapherotrites archaeon]|nr:hypothetical protein [Candidatus Diapherotrites archaeon]